MGSGVFSWPSQPLVSDHIMAELAKLDATPCGSFVGESLARRVSHPPVLGNGPIDFLGVLLVVFPGRSQIFASQRWVVS